MSKLTTNQKLYLDACVFKNIKKELNQKVDKKESGNVDLNGTLNVEGESTLTDLNIVNTLTVTEKTNLNSDLDVSGNVKIDNNLTIDGELDVSGNVKMDNNLTVDGELDVSGNGKSSSVTYTLFTNTDKNSSNFSDGNLDKRISSVTF